MPEESPIFPEEPWHMGPETYSDLLRLEAECGYGGGDKFASEVMRRYHKEPYKTYRIIVHFEWDTPRKVRYA